MVGCSKYEEITQDSEIVLKERRCKMIFKNPSRVKVIKIKVDGGAIKEDIRCDYLVIILSTHEECFVELKGKDVAHAIKQIEASIKRLRKKGNDFNTFAYIVITRYPVLTTTTQNLIKDLKNKFKITLRIKKQCCTHIISPRDMSRKEKKVY